MIKNVTTLFWNINNKDLTDNIVNLVVSHKVDIVILAESGANDSKLLRALNSKETCFYYNSSYRKNHKIKIFSKFNNEMFRPALEQSDRLTIRRLKISDKFEINIAALHMISKMSFSEKSQQFETLPYIHDINNAEKFCGHSRTIVIGDFNMNPFEEALIAGTAFNAVSCRRIAVKGKRTIQGKQYNYFYNPSWNLLGDFNKPGGTYYYPKSEHVNYKWNVYDQILIRPTLIEYFDQDTFQVVINDGKESLITEEGLPDSEYSDHLPVLFNLNFRN